MNAVTTACGTSKETVYRHFGSKSGLVGELLQKRSDDTILRLAAAIGEAGSEPKDQLAAYFGELGVTIAEPGYAGCSIVKTATTIRPTDEGSEESVGLVSSGQTNPDPADFARYHFERHLDLLRQICDAAKVADADRVARQVFVLAEGVLVIAGATQSMDGTLELAAEAAEMLVFGSR